MALVTTNLPTLKLIARGKVRDIYDTSNPSCLLFVATDRISAYDVVLNNGIPSKGKILTSLSLLWFGILSDIIPNHLVTTDIDIMPKEVRQYRSQLEGRTMLVKKAKVIPIEAIVRGYLTGSAWAEYRKSQTVHRIPLPPDLVESSPLPTPLFTPSTKAEQGAHDENIHPDEAARLIGKDLYDQVSDVAVRLYSRAATYAVERGVILADTKFEFGLIEEEGTSKLILVDEVLTPDSSRYWPLASYVPGKPQPSFDKQYLRDWLTSQGFVKGLEMGKDGASGWTIDNVVVEETRRRYQEAWEILKKSA